MLPGVVAARQQCGLGIYSDIDKARKQTKKSGLAAAEQRMQDAIIGLLGCCIKKTSHITPDSIGLRRFINKLSNILKEIDSAKYNNIL